MAKIVLADDDDDLRAVYSAALRAEGHEVWEAVDGREAIQQTQTRRPDLLLLDIWMPALNGFEVLDALRHDSAGIHLRIVVVSNLADAEARLEAFEAGACEYLVKGAPLTDLLRQVREILGRAEALTFD
jgi:DNA-binding response OmpR family regulator